MVQRYGNHIGGHFLWDADPTMCTSSCKCENDQEIQIPNPAKSRHSISECRESLHPLPEDHNPDIEPCKTLQYLASPEVQAEEEESAKYCQKSEQWFLEADLRRQQLTEKIVKWQQDLEEIHREAYKKKNPLPLTMLSPLSEDDFPPLQRKVDITGRISSKPYV